MCFSPEVDVIAASTITIVAIDALKHNKNLRTLPIALLPTVFAIHTFSDAFVWWGARGQVTADIAAGAEWTYLFIAFILLPILVPIATNLIEPKGWQKNALSVIVFVGILSGVDNIISFSQGQTSVEACNYYVDYHVFGTTTLNGAFYAMATIGAMLLSRQKYLFRWGLVNIVVVIALAIWANHQLPSLWCFWAAVTCVFVSWFLREIEREHDQGLPWPWQRKDKINIEVV